MIFKKNEINPIKNLNNIYRLYFLSMHRRNNRPPKRRAAPVKIIDINSIPEDDEEDELPHECEEKILNAIEASSSTESSNEERGDSVSSSGENETPTKPKKEKTVSTPKSVQNKQQLRVFKCNFSNVIPNEGSPTLKNFEEKTYESSTPIAAARLIIEDIASLPTKKKIVSYFIIIEECEPSKKFSYLATSSENKWIVATHPMKNITKLLPKEDSIPVQTEKLMVVKRPSVPEQKQIIDKKIIPSLVNISQNVISDKAATKPLAPKKKNAKK